MPYQPFPVESFRGLDIQSDALDVGATGAVDLLNVEFDRAGRVRTRHGYGNLNNTSVAQPLAMAHYPAWARVIVTTAAGFRSLQDFNGTLLHTAVLADPRGLAPFGTGTTAYMYVSTEAAGISRFHGGTGVLTAVAGSPNAKFLAAWGQQGRLVSAKGAIGGQNDYRVHFSAAGDGDTWGANDWVDVRPNDGQLVTGLAVWRDLLFVFKSHSFFVFYGVSTDSTGKPIFNYRPVDTGIGCASGCQMWSGPDGIYFVHDNGVYRTRGDAPELVSAELQPYFDNEATGFGVSSISSVISAQMTGSTDRLYVQLNDTATTFVRDLRSGHWSAWQLANQPYAMLGRGNRYLQFADVNAKFYAATGTSTDDNGVAIPWSYKSGLYSPVGDPGRVAVTRESKMIGSGSVALKVATYDAGSGGVLDTGSTVALGTSPAVSEGWQQIDREGGLFQHQLSGSGPASVSRLTHYLESIKPTGVQ